MLVEFSDGNAYDLSAIKVKPMPVLKPGGVLLDGKTLKLSWDGENLSDSAKIIVTASGGRRFGRRCFKRKGNFRKR